jgi:hypothetical protein
MESFQEFITEWKKSEPTTKHNHPMVFGKKEPQGKCPRCDELHSGKPTIKWAKSRKQHDAQRNKEVLAHFASDHHKSGKCGPVCTFGEW